MVNENDAATTINKSSYESNTLALGHLVDCSQAQPVWEGAQRLRGNQVVSVATYIVGGIQVTASIDEEPNQGGEVVPHSEMHWTGSLLGSVRETQIN